MQKELSELDRKKKKDSPQKEEISRLQEARKIAKNLQALVEVAIEKKNAAK